MEKLKWHTEQRIINDLIPYEGNPRKMTKEQAKQLQKSLEKFNLAEIPAIDTDNKIIVGHQRIKILQILDRGKETIDVRLPNRKLTDEEFREYNLRSNKNTGNWDFDLLANYDIEMLENVGWDKKRDVQSLDKYYKRHEFIIYSGAFGGEKTIDGDVWELK